MSANKRRVLNFFDFYFGFKIILTQGLNRQIRRMCDTLGYKVVRLKRIRVMNIELGKLKVGTYRKVSPMEKKILLSYLK